MTRNDSERLHQIRSRWEKEQQLIRQKYQIPFNITYTSKQCYSKPTQAASLFKHNQITVTDDDRKRKTDRINKDWNIPPMYCSKCHLNLTACLCQDGLGQWWRNSQKGSYSIDKMSKKSLINSMQEQHVSFDQSLTDLSSIERISSQKVKSKSNKQQYVLLNWNNRQSLLHFIQTTQLNQNLSNMSIEQLRQLITNNNHIYLFTSIIDLILTMNQTSLCQIYIDPFYYSTIQGTTPFLQSEFIADNIDLNRALYSIQKMAILLGVKMNPSVNKKISTKQRKTILNHQSLFIASKIPYNTCRDTSVHTQ